MWSVIYQCWVNYKRFQRSEKDSQIIALQIAITNKNYIFMYDLKGEILSHRGLNTHSTTKSAWASSL